MSYRILQVSPSRFCIEESGLFGWSAIGGTDQLGIFDADSFPSLEAAQARIDELTFKPRVVG